MNVSPKNPIERQKQMRSVVIMQYVCGYKSNTDSRSFDFRRIINIWDIFFK